MLLLAIFTYLLLQMWIVYGLKIKIVFDYLLFVICFLKDKNGERI